MAQPPIISESICSSGLSRCEIQSTGRICCSNDGPMQVKDAPVMTVYFRCGENACTTDSVSRLSDNRRITISSAKV